MEQVSKGIPSLAQEARAHLFNIGLREGVHEAVTRAQPSFAPQDMPGNIQGPAPRWSHVNSRRHELGPCRQLGRWTRRLAWYKTVHEASLPMSMRPKRMFS